MSNHNNQNQKPLSLSGLVSYNQKVLFPTMKRILVAKKEFCDFKNSSFKSQDKMLKKLDILLTEKEVREY